MRETQPKDLEEAPLKEGEMVEDSIPKVPWKEMKDTIKQRKDQILQVREEEGVMISSTLLQPIGPLQQQPHQKTGSSQIEAALNQDLHL